MVLGAVKDKAAEFASAPARVSHNSMAFQGPLDPWLTVGSTGDEQHGRCMGETRITPENLLGETNVFMGKSTGLLDVSDLSPLMIMAIMRSVPQMGAEPAGMSIITVILTVSEIESLTVEVIMGTLVDC